MRVVVGWVVELAVIAAFGVAAYPLVVGHPEADGWLPPLVADWWTTAPTLAMGSAGWFLLGPVWAWFGYRVVRAVSG